MKVLSYNDIENVTGGGEQKVQKPEEVYKWEEIGCSGGSGGMSCSFNLGQLHNLFHDAGVALGNAIYDAIH